MTARRRPAFTAMVLLALGLTACGGASGPSSPRSSSSSAISPKPSVASSTGPLKKIMVGIPNTGLVYLPHQVAIAKGFFKQQGFDVTLQVGQSQTLLASTSTGEMAFTDLAGSAMRASAQGLPVKMVECQSVRPLYFLVLAKSTKSVADLSGGNVSVNALGSDVEVVGKSIIKNHGGDPTKETFVALGAASARYAALEAGRVQAAVLAVDEAVKARDAGYTIVNTISELPTACGTGIVASNASIKDQPQSVTRFLRAINDAVRFIQSNRTETAQILADWQKYSVATGEASYDLGDAKSGLFSVDKAVQEEAIKAGLKFLQDAGDVKPDVTFATVADLSLFPSS